MRTRATLAIALAAGLAAGCGIQGDDPLSKTDFVEQANAICAASNQQAEPFFDAIWADEGDPSDDGLIFVRFADAMAEIKPIFDQQLEELRALEPPKEDKEFVENLLSDQQQALDTFMGVVDAAAGGDASARAAMESDDDGFADIDRRAREYGLTVCGAED